ncbi:GIY-YIG nuclease family protein [Rhodohalobacter sp. 614A]|uniref:GIY-YIG nuclease family protein n=1 Tax=Rhodohalobacter sp. 614A TaxID=2908649 RepID=UPI001F340149|nr:GIY-YIG nuclease family protein [Rhodohalobacter sp. 614A]
MNARRDGRADECGGLAPKGSLREKPSRLYKWEVETKKYVLFSVYILRSTKTGNHYYGHTKNLEKRLKAHNDGKVRSTKAYRPWKIIYTEKFLTTSEAFRRELFFKSIEGYQYLKKEKII